MGGEKLKMTNNEKLEELLESLKEINKILESATDDMDTKEDYEKFLNAGIKGEAHIHIDKDKKNGYSAIKIEGSTPAILVALAGSEKAILKQLHVPSGVFDLVKHSIGTKEAK